jgi:glycyl-radical enzyme activating protein
MEDSKGLIFDIQRFSLFNGPGIRTTVFFKGCPLRCSWCHNPEGVKAGPELLFSLDRCVGCGNCITACVRDVHRQGPDGAHTLDRQYCTVCGACARVCPSDALELCGDWTSVREIMAVVLRDRDYYADSGGGLTLSGGEPLLQPEFAKALLTMAKAEGLHTALETSGCAVWARIEAILTVTDLFLFDIKETDATRHAQWTGVQWQPIRENLQRLAATGARIVLRLPVAPGYNDRLDHFQAVADLARELGVTEADLLPYHRFGESKLAALGRGDVPPACREPDQDTVRQWQARFAQAGLMVRLVEEQQVDGGWDPLAPLPIPAPTAMETLKE